MNDIDEGKMLLNNLLRAACVVAVASIATAPARAADISGAGATFPYPIYSKWADAYKKETGNGLNYQSIGSGAGIKQILAKTVTFGASDAPLKEEKLKKDGLVQWPQVMGGIVPVVNIEGVKPGELVLDGKTLADIEVRGNHGFLIVGVRRSGGETTLNPSPSTGLSSGIKVAPPPEDARRRRPGTPKITPPKTQWEIQCTIEENGDDQKDFVLSG